MLIFISSFSVIFGAENRQTLSTVMDSKLENTFWPNPILIKHGAMEHYKDNIKENIKDNIKDKLGLSCAKLST